MKFSASVTPILLWLSTAETEANDVSAGKTAGTVNAAHKVRIAFRFLLI